MPYEYETLLKWKKHKKNYAEENINDFSPLSLEHTVEVTSIYKLSLQALYGFFDTLIYTLLGFLVLFC